MLPQYFLYLLHAQVGFNRLLQELGPVLQESLVKMYFQLDRDGQAFFQIATGVCTLRNGFQLALKDKLLQSYDGIMEQLCMVAANSRPATVSQTSLYADQILCQGHLNEKEQQMVMRVPGIINVSLTLFKNMCLFIGTLWFWLLWMKLYQNTSEKQRFLPMFRKLFSCNGMVLVFESF